MPIDPDTNRELDLLKSNFESIIIGIELRIADRIAADRETVRVALAANEKRLDAMTDARETLAEHVGELITRRESEAARSNIIDKTEGYHDALDRKIDNEINALGAKVEQLSTPNWALMASIVSLFLVMVTGVWIVIGLKIDATLTPLSLQIQEVKVAHAADAIRLNTVVNDAAASTQADATQRTATAQADNRLRNVEDTQSHLTAQVAAMDQKLVEVETQFCASDIIRNLMHATDLRLMSMMWHKLSPDTPYPIDNAYYPQVCNRSTLPVNGR